VDPVARRCNLNPKKTTGSPKKIRKGRTELDHTDPMSAVGQKQTFRNVRAMSAIPPKADIRSHDQDVCFGPGADSCNATKRILFDYLIGTAQQCDRKAEPHRLGSLKIDDQFNFALLYNGQVADPFAF
jgi:hypothetical protein